MPFYRNELRLGLKFTHLRQTCLKNKQTKGQLELIKFNEKHKQLSLYVNYVIKQKKKKV